MARLKERDLLKIDGSHAGRRRRSRGTLDAVDPLPKASRCPRKRRVVASRVAAGAIGLTVLSGCVQLLGTDLDALFLRDEPSRDSSAPDAQTPQDEASTRDRIDGALDAGRDAQPKGTTVPPPDAGFTLRGTSLVTVTVNDIKYCAYDAAGYVRTAQCSDQRWAIYVPDSFNAVQFCLPETLVYSPMGPNGAPSYTATCWAVLGTELRTVENTVLVERSGSTWLRGSFLFEELPGESSAPGIYLRDRFGLAERSYVSRATNSLTGVPDGGSPVITFYKLYPRKPNDSQLWVFE